MKFSSQFAVGIWTRRSKVKITEVILKAGGAAAPRKRLPVIGREEEIACGQLSQQPPTQYTRWGRYCTVSIRTLKKTTRLASLHPHSPLALSSPDDSHRGAPCRDPVTATLEPLQDTLACGRHCTWECPGYSIAILRLVPTLRDHCHGKAGRTHFAQHFYA